MRWIRWALTLAFLLSGCASGGGADRPSEAMPFDNPGVNVAVDVDEDRLSTFAVDVDTGAYTIARRYVTDGSLPPPDSVRVEEFVNYFDHGYEPPGEEAFAVHVDGSTTPFTHSPGDRLMRVGIQSRAPQPATRRRAALTFVVDVSGSMADGNRLGLVRESLELLVEQLRPSDTVALVTYGTTARVRLHPTPASDADRILRVLADLRPEGSTNAEAGLRLGYELAAEAFAEGDINRVILASDGLANVGVTRPRALLRAVRNEADRGIQLTTMGVGMGDYNDPLMEQLADGGDGSYAYVDSLSEASRMFEDQLTTTLDVVALDAKVQVEFTDAVRRYRLVGYENRDVADERFTDDSVAAGAVGPGHAVTALYEVTVAGDAESAASIATVNVRWSDPGTREPRTLEHQIDEADIAGSFADASAHFRLAAAVGAYAEVLRDSPYAVGVGLEQVARVARNVSGELPADRKAAEFAALVSTAAGLGG